MLSQWKIHDECSPKGKPFPQFAECLIGELDACYRLIN